MSGGLSLIFHLVLFFHSFQLLGAKYKHEILVDHTRADTGSCYGNFVLFLLLFMCLHILLCHVLFLTFQLFLHVNVNGEKSSFSLKWYMTVNQAFPAIFIPHWCTVKY